MGRDVEGQSEMQGERGKMDGGRVTEGEKMTVEGRGGGAGVSAVGRLRD